MVDDTPLQPWRLGLALLAALGSVALSYHFQLGIEKQVAIALGRAIVQLLLLGYVLLHFLFSMNSPILVFTYISIMLLIAAVEVTNRQTRSYVGHYFDSVVACTIGGAMVGIYGTLIVFAPIPWWNPRVFIPTSGMIIGSSVSGPAVAVDRLLAEVSDKRHETEVRLSFGATGFEALLPPVRAAIMAAMMPQLNVLSIIGIVAIPGMMTGQLIGGATPLTAAEYQMGIIFLILASTCLSTYIAIMLTVKRAVMSPFHRLTPERIIKKVGPKVALDAAIVAGVTEAFCGMYQSLKKWCCCLALCAPMFRALPTAPPQARSGRRGGGEQYSPLPSLELTSRSTHGMLGESRNELEEAPYKVTYTLQCNFTKLSSQASDAHSSNADPPVLEITGLNVLSGEVNLFPSTGLRLSIYPGQRVSVEGPSGIGKTRLLRALAQLEEPVSGTLILKYASSNAEMNTIATYGKEESQQLDGTQTFDLMQIAIWRSRVVYIPQALPPLAGTPIEFIREALKYKSRVGHAEHPDLERSCAWIEHQLLLQAGKLSQAWSALSGGERQRAIIACGVIVTCPQGVMYLRDAHNVSGVGEEEGGSVGSSLDLPHQEAQGTPGMSSDERGDHPSTSNSAALPGNVPKSHAVLLLDEPTAACDPQACAAVERLLVTTGVACVVVTHDERQAARLATTRVLLAE